MRNDLGLLSEEYDTDAGRMVDNFPQAFSHLAIVNSARVLSEHEPASGLADRLGAADAS